jgi:ABC-type nitrate/sulfonate/bicarbonate transport system substrate-binding protein
MSFYRPIPLVAADAVWIAPAPAPTLTGLALTIGRLRDAFAEVGLGVRSIREPRNPAFREQGYHHDLKYLLREGGSFPALWTRAAGRDHTVVVGLTWVDEAQYLLARPKSGLACGDLSRLAGQRLALPAPTGRDHWRAMALRAYNTAVRLGGLTSEDVVATDIETPDGWRNAAEAALLTGEVDVIYAKGAQAVTLQQAHDLDIVLDINQIRDARYRINNGTPRPVTVHRHLLDDQPDLVVRYLKVLLETESWARANPKAVTGLIAAETGTDEAAVKAAYGRRLADGFGLSLDKERRTALQDQADFLARHGLIAGCVDVEDWIDSSPLNQAMESLPDAVVPERQADIGRDRISGALRGRRA